MITLFFSQRERGFIEKLERAIDEKGIVSISLHMGTDVVRENFLLVMVAITMAICSMAYEAVVRVAPWMVGKKKVKE